MPNFKGVIETVKDGKRLKMNNGNWYSAFAASQTNEAAVGDTVSFMYAEGKPDSNGNPYLNIKGNVTIVAKAASSAASPVTAAQGTPTTKPALPYLDSRGYVLKQFPVPADHPDRSIIRQNSLSHACKFFELNALRGEADVEDIISVARIFETYSSGETDEAAIKQLLADMRATESS